MKEQHLEAVEILGRADRLCHVGRPSPPPPRRSLSAVRGHLLWLDKEAQALLEAWCIITAARTAHSVT